MTRRRLPGLPPLLAAAAALLAPAFAAAQDRPRDPDRRIAELRREFQRQTQRLDEERATLQKRFEAEIERLRRGPEAPRPEAKRKPEPERPRRPEVERAPAGPAPERLARAVAEIVKRLDAFEQRLRRLEQALRAGQSRRDR